MDWTTLSNPYFAIQVKIRRILQQNGKMNMLLFDVLTMKVVRDRWKKEGLSQCFFKFHQKAC